MRRRYSAQPSGRGRGGHVVRYGPTTAAKPMPDGTTPSVQKGKPCATCPVCNHLVRVIKAPFNDKDANILIGHPIFSNHTETGMKAPHHVVPCFGSAKPLGRMRYELYYPEEQ